MILVTQGHEKGIGLEVLLKSIVLAPPTWAQQVCLFANKTTVNTHLKSLGLNAQLTNEGIVLNNSFIRCEWIKSSASASQSMASIQEALDALNNFDNPVLFTLPTTKDALKINKKDHLGHTEFLRSKYKSPELGMFFTADDLNVLLLTDHVPLEKVSSVITAKAFRNKMILSLNALSSIEPKIQNVLVAGINPHAGEGGLLGSQEKRLTSSLQKLCDNLKQFEISGFYPGDTIFRERSTVHDLLVYMHHDQGLAPFKALKGTLGANVTLGLPFLRLSVDHGTAFALYGKNCSDYRGAYFCIRKALIYRERLCGQNSSQQGQGSQS